MKNIQSFEEFEKQNEGFFSGSNIETKLKTLTGVNVSKNEDKTNEIYTITSKNNWVNATVYYHKLRKEFTILDKIENNLRTVVKNIDEVLNYFNK